MGHTILKTLSRRIAVDVARFNGSGGTLFVTKSADGASTRTGRR